MHHIHHTHGFILSSRNTGEANKMLTIYTRELGLIKAVAQGVRFHKSKLRFTLQDFSYVNVDLVRGKEIWRVTSARHISSFSLARSNTASLVLIMRVSNLLERLCHGESPNENIFNDFIQALYLLDDENVSSQSREALELHLVLRILNSLGYIGDSAILEKYLSSAFDQSKIEVLLKERQSIIAHINNALNESQL
ncbi:MAG: DNA repair protein RecO [Candidatus Paceibacterota bacterium]|jgi:DNA repair protein RecO